MSANETINNRIKAIMDHNSLNINSFTKRIGLENNTIIGKIMQIPGRRPSYDTIVRILKSFPKLSCRWLLTGEGTMYIGIEDFASKTGGSLVFFYVNIRNGFDVSREPNSVMVLHGFEDCQVATYYFGEPMGMFSHGDIILCNKCDTDIIINGTPHLIATKSGPVIRNATRVDDTIRIHDGKLPDIIVRISDITAIYQIKGVIKRVAV